MAALVHMANRVVLPGDVLCSVQDLHSSVAATRLKLRLGPGLRQDGEQIVAFKPGVLRHRAPAMYWVDTNQKRYVPVKEERVIGFVTNRGGDSYKVDIGTSSSASLSSLAFEGATKRNKPNIQIGDLVYCRLSVANKDMEPELDCTDGSGRSTGLGPLSGGFVFSCSLGLTRKLLNKDYILLKLLGKCFPFECTVGLNGRVWINAKSTVHIIAISNAITNAEYMTDQQIETMVRQLVEGIM